MLGAENLDLLVFCVSEGPLGGVVLCHLRLSARMTVE